MNINHFTQFLRNTKNADKLLITLIT